MTVSPVEELHRLFEENGPVDFARMRRLAIIIKLRIPDRAAADALHADLEAAVLMFENVRENGRWLFSALQDQLDAMEQ